MLFLEEYVRRPLLEGTPLDEYVARPCKEWYLGFRRLR